MGLIHFLYNKFKKTAKPYTVSELRPLCSDEEYEKLPYNKKCIFVCNKIGCGKVVSNHGLLCVECTIKANNGDYGPQLR
jgi:hypothetical protein